MREQHLDGIVMTETKTAESPEDLFRRQPGSGALWPGVRFFHTPGTGATGGILVILGPSPHLTDVHLFPSTGATDLLSDGRVLRLDLLLHSFPTTILAMYAPAQSAERLVFYSSSILPFLPPPTRPLLVVGDFNCVESAQDCVYPLGLPPANNTRLIGYAALDTSLSAPYGLRDVWRTQHPTSSDFTHFSASALSGARLDRWLASPPFLSHFPSPSSEILPACGIRSDHLPVLLTIPLPSQPDSTCHGRGLAGFPLFLLNIPEAERELSAFVAQKATDVLLGNLATIVERWNACKEDIRSESWRIYRDHRKRRQAAARAAEAAASEARAALLSSPTPATPALLATWRASVSAALDE